jgi:hypothetical protein
MPVAGAETPVLPIVRVPPGAGNRDIPTPAVDEDDFGNAELAPPGAAPPYPNREGCLSPVDEATAADAIGSLLGAALLVFEGTLESTVEVGLPSLDFAFAPITEGPSTDPVSAGLMIFDAKL